MRELYLPTLFCPIEASINPQLAEAIQHNIEWGIRFGLTPPSGEKFRRYCLHRYAHIAARVFPFARIELLNIAADWSALISYFDDQYFDASSKSNAERIHLEKQFIAIAEGRKPKDPIDIGLWGLQDIIQRLKKNAQEFWRLRFVLALKNYMESISWERLLQQEKKDISLATYNKMRTHGFGAPIAFSLLGAFLNFKETKFAELAYVKELEIIANHCSAWCNDLLGLGRDLEEISHSNVVLVIKNHYQLDLQSAVNQTVRLFNEELQSFFELEKQIPFLPEAQDFIEELTAYIQGLKHWTRGFIDWSIESGRYRKVYSNPLDLSDHFPTEKRKPLFESQKNLSTRL